MLTQICTIKVYVSCRGQFHRTASGHIQAAWQITACTEVTVSITVRQTDWLMLSISSEDVWGFKL